MPVYKQAKLVRHRGKEIPRCMRLQDIHGNWVTFLYVSQLPTERFVGKVLVRTESGKAVEVWPTALDAKILIPGRRSHDQEADSQAVNAG